MSSNPQLTRQTSEAQQLTLSDGRILAYQTYGSSSPSHHAFYFHSYPGSRLEAAMLHAAAAAQDINLIAVDRPGMGASTFQPQRRILDCPSDILALADHLGIAQFACIGTSGGGPYVLACHREIPATRLRASMVVAGLWPTALGTQGMLLESRIMLFLAPWMPGLVAAGLDFGLGNAARDTKNPAKFEALVAKTFESRTGVDADVWKSNKNGFQEIVVTSLREALKNGATGSGHEAKLFGSDWGFSLEDVKVQEKQLAIWHGGQDQNVPPAMAQKASKLIAGCEFTLFPDDGHVSLIAGKSEEFLGRVKLMLES
ncbi:Alpha/Beta hydrolase protein [Thelonectria olida]|uniref:Alpha/Beta hydrolase protein n=1 Tax=Thelonectria olida TaxID=1576542 RepID=A0A9P8VYP8_9HYPO|nr:Alpha/Beta hydrolase protein [Thelonectria olida]